MFTSGNKVIDFEMSFPPGEEVFDVPSEFIYDSDLFSSEVETVGSDPIFYIVNFIANETNFFLSLVDFGSAEQDDGIIKNNAVRFEFMGFNECFFSFCQRSKDLWH